MSYNSILFAELRRTDKSRHDSISSPQEEPGKAICSEQTCRELVESVEGSARTIFCKSRKENFSFAFYKLLIYNCISIFVHMKTPEQMGGKPEEVEPMAESSPEKKEGQELQARTEKALELAVKYGGIDGDHHKAWVIDQIVRQLTGCPTVQQEGTDVHGKKYTYDALGESEEYRELVRKAREGEDGPETYDWNTGIAP